MATPQPMPKARIRNGELTMPLTEEVRAKLDVHEGDELEAHVYRGGLSITPTSDAARQLAGKSILDLIDRVRVRPGQPHMSEKEIDLMIDEEVKAFRSARRKDA